MPRVLSMFSCSRVLCVNCRLPRSIACFSSLREIQVAHLHHQVKSREALFLRRVIPEIWTRISETGDPRPTKTLRFFLLASFFFVFCFVFCSALWTVRVCLSYQRPQQQPTTVVKTSTSSTSSQRELSYPILFTIIFYPPTMFLVSFRRLSSGECCMIGQRRRSRRTLSDGKRYNTLSDLMDETLVTSQ